MPARPSYPCPQCDETFTEKARLKRHRESAHRARYGHNAPVYKPLDTIPADITEIKVKELYFFGRETRNKRECPPGYDPALMPLAKVSYF